MPPKTNMLHVLEVELEKAKTQLVELNNDYEILFYEYQKLRSVVDQIERGN